MANECFTSVFRYAALIGLLIACGKVQRADEQEHGLLMPPPFPSEVAPFTLTEDRAVANFEGSLIVWDVAPTPEKIKAVSDASIKGRKVKAEALAFLAETLLPAQQPLAEQQAALDKIDAEIARYEAQGFSRPEMKLRTREVVAGWFETRLAELQRDGAIDTAAHEHARQYFGAYCEGKLWQFATSSLLLEAYAERPTPSQMCEPYYAERGYFQDATLCGAASEQDGVRHYFDCVWRDGVFKSPLLPASVSGCGDPRVAVASWLDAALLQEILRDQELEPLATNTYAGLFQSLVLDGQNLRTTSALAVKYPRLAECRSLFRRDLTGADWRLAQPKALLDIAEVAQADVGAGMRFTLLPDAGADELNRQNYAKLAGYVKLFNERHVVSAEALAASYSDYLFNHPAGATLEANGKTNECRILGAEALGREASEDCPAQGDAAFRELAELTRQFVPEEVKAERLRRLAALDQALEALSQAKQGYMQRLGAVKQAAVEGAMAVNAPGATRLFTGYGMQLVRVSTDTLMVAIRFKDAASGLYACIRLDGAEACELPAALHSGLVPLEGATFDPVQGRLTVRIPLHDPAALGFGPKSREAEGLSLAYNEFPAEVLQNRTLEIAMYANRLANRLNFFTGGVTLWDGEQALASGSVSGDDFAAAQQQVLGGMSLAL